MYLSAHLRPQSQRRLFLMPTRTISRDLKNRIPVLFYRDGYNVKEICTILGVQKTMVYRALTLYRHFGQPYNPFAKKGGRPRVLSRIDLKYINSLVQRRHTMYLDELQDKLLQNRGTSVSVTTIYRALRRLNYTNKRVSAVALERNDLDRDAFMNSMANIVTRLDQLVFIDEAARNRKTSGRIHGWARSGAKCMQRRFFVRGQRYSILPALTIDGIYLDSITPSFPYLTVSVGIITHDIVHGSVNSHRFLDFLREQVIPLTNPYPGPRSVIVMDNCSIHHAAAVRELIEDEAGCKLVYLPPYSPDFNPIEEAFSAIKAYLRRHYQDQSLSVMDRACHSITSGDARTFFRASGYVV